MEAARLTDLLAPLRVGMVHGRLKAAERDEVMSRVPGRRAGRARGHDRHRGRRGRAGGDRDDHLEAPTASASRSSTSCAVASAGDGPVVLRARVRPTGRRRWTRSPMDRRCGRVKDTTDGFAPRRAGHRAAQGGRAARSARRAGCRPCGSRRWATRDTARMTARGTRSGRRPWSDADGRLVEGHAALEHELTRRLAGAHRRRGRAARQDELDG